MDSEYEIASAAFRKQIQEIIAKLPTKTIKVVINTCYGGFGISKQGCELYKLKSGNDLNKRRVKRDDPHLVKVVEELGEQANAGCAKLKIETITLTAGERWSIDEYDGIESINVYWDLGL